MRYVVLAILIALLPLRSVAGDAMAIQMATSTIAASSASEPAHADCMEHAAMAADGAMQDQTPDANGHCNTCASCQACSAVAFVFPEAAVSLPPLPHTVPSWSAVHFTSADRALGQKPPIS
ncbi:MAG: hypothetical protein H7Y28_10150 [Rhodoferax sp.]|nr:hypothetical protein [Rhodoferax sp.]